MACNNCSELDPIPECTDNILLGTIEPDTEVYIYVKNLSSGYVHREETTSDEDGYLTLDLTEPDPTYYNSDSHYEVWATLRTDNVRLDITYAYGLIDSCLSLSFFRVNDTTEEAEA
jgi:hypothetical protein